MDYNTKHIKSLGETLYSYKHKTGLRVFVIEKSGFSKTYAIYGTKFGSVNNTFVPLGKEEPITVPDGVAHFLEHKLFSQKDGSAMDKFAAMGASSNAYTSFTHTAYLFSCTEGFDDNFKLLLNFVQNPYITDESVENEKGIIGQEIRMYEDDPDWQLYFKFIESLYKDYPVKKDIAGTIDTISGIDRELLYKCFKTFYDISNMVIFVVGDLKPEDVFAQIENELPVDKDSLEIKQFTTDETEEIARPFVESKLEVALPMFMFGFKVNPEHENIVKEEIATDIALEMLCGKSSSLYESLYSEGLVTGPIATDITFEKEYSFIAMSGESRDTDTAISKLKEAIEKMKAEDIDEETFERIRKRLTGEFIRSFNSVDKIAHMFISNIMRGVNIFDYANEYANVTKKDVKDAINKYFDMNKMAISVVKPNE